MKRIMRDFRIDEISAVDKPAQTAARVAIIKRSAPREAQPVQSTGYAFKPSARLDAVADAIVKAVKARNRQEATMYDKEHDADDIRKRAADALRSMNDYVEKRDRRVSKVAAQEAWRKLHPDEYAEMQAAAPTPPVDPVAKRASTVEFGMLVDAAQREHHCDRTTAMEIVRKQDAAAFAKLQAGA